MFNDHAEGIEAFLRKSINVDDMKYKLGSNYVNAEIVMSLREEENNREVIGMIYNDVDDWVCDTRV